MKAYKFSNICVCVVCSYQEFISQGFISQEFISRGFSSCFFLSLAACPALLMYILIQAPSSLHTPILLHTYTEFEEAPLPTNR